MHCNILSGFTILGFQPIIRFEKKFKRSEEQGNTAWFIAVNEFKKIFKITWLSIILLIFAFPLPVTIGIDSLMNLNKLFLRFEDASENLWGIAWSLMKLINYLYFLLNAEKCSLFVRAILKFRRKYKWQTSLNEKCLILISFIGVCLPLFQIGTTKTNVILSTSFHNFIESFVCSLFFVYSTGIGRVIRKYCDALKNATETREIPLLTVSSYNVKKRQFKSVPAKSLCGLFWEMEEALLQIYDIDYCLMDLLALPIAVILMNCLTSITMSLYHLISGLHNRDETFQAGLLFLFALQLLNVLMLTSPPDAINNAVSCFSYFLFMIDF